MLFRIPKLLWEALWHPDRIVVVNTKLGTFRINVSERARTGGELSANIETGEGRFLVIAMFVLVLVCIAFLFYIEKESRSHDVMYDIFLYNTDETLFRGAFLYWRMKIGAEWLVTPTYAIMVDPDGVLMGYTDKFLNALNERIATIDGFEDLMASMGETLIRIYYKNPVLFESLLRRNRLLENVVCAVLEGGEYIIGKAQYSTYMLENYGKVRFAPLLPASAKFGHALELAVDGG